MQTRQEWNIKNERRKMLNNKIAEEIDYQLILNIWEKSVIATHDFLNPEDILFYKNKIPAFLNYLELRIWFLNEEPIGFSGTNKEELDMLFLDPSKIGGGYGHQIFSWLLDNKNIYKVDVNEQNEHAKNFYLKHNYEVKSRSERDSFNKPYPILHLERKRVL